MCVDSSARSPVQRAMLHLAQGQFLRLHEPVETESDDASSFEAEYSVRLTSRKEMSAEWCKSHTECKQEINRLNMAIRLSRYGHGGICFKVLLAQNMQVSPMQMKNTMADASAYLPVNSRSKCLGKRCDLLSKNQNNEAHVVGTSSLIDDADRLT